VGKGVTNYMGPNGTVLVDPSFLTNFVMNKECFYYHKKGHLRFQCPKLKGRDKRHKRECEYSRCTQVGHSTLLNIVGKAQMIVEVGLIIGYQV
jgi:hypothetical protein